MGFTLLTEDQIWGDGALEVMKRYGTKVAPTDLTVILGVYMTGDGDRTSEGDLTCASWSASSSDHGGVRCVDCKGVENWAEPCGRRGVSVRPALPPSEASKINLKEKGIIKEARVVEYGQYPQTVADARTSNQLEALFNSETLSTTGKNYTFDSVGLMDYFTSFKAKSYPEYELDGKRYIRVPGRPADDDDSTLSTGEQVEEGKPYWVEVQPIEWFMDKSGWMVSKKCLFAGIEFDRNEQYQYNGDFEKTFMKRYLDTYFAKEMEPSEREADRTALRDSEKSIDYLQQLKRNFTR